MPDAQLKTCRIEYCLLEPIWQQQKPVTVLDQRNVKAEFKSV